MKMETGFIGVLNMDMKTYTVSVNFGGYIGCDEEYKVDASSEEEAMELAMNLAVDDLSVEVVGVEDEED